MFVSNTPPCSHVAENKLKLRAAWVEGAMEQRDQYERIERGAESVDAPMGHQGLEVNLPLRYERDGERIVSRLI